MEKLGDLAVLYISLIVAGIMCEIDVSMVVAMLMSVIFICIGVMFKNETLKEVLNLVYIVISFIYEGFLFFIPVMLYNSISFCLRTALLCVVVTVRHCYNMPLMIPFSLVGIYLALKNANFEKYKNNFFEMIMNNKEIKEKFDREKRESTIAWENEVKVATLAERNRIAREIHDNVGHMITRSILQIGALKIINKNETVDLHLDMLQATLDDAMKSIRESVHDLKDESVDIELTINAMIKEYSGFAINFDNGLESELTKEVKYCFIAVIKEALTNVVRHSDADRVDIVLREHPAVYQLVIKDNGSKKNTTYTDGIGLINMRERVSALKGNINIGYENGFKVFVSIMR